MESEWVWMPHAGHFICSDRCLFRLNTYVPGGYIISTVGELMFNGQMEDVSYNSRYETMVFHAVETGDLCCPYQMSHADEINCQRYNTAGEARLGHLEMCRKYDSRP